MDLSRRRLLQLSGAAAASVVLTGPPAVAASAGAAAHSPGAGGPSGLLTDLLPQGLGMTAGQQPRFSWQVPDFGAGTTQRAYQVQLAATPDAWDDRRRVLWDSGRTESADSVAVPYGGPALRPRTAYWWRVRS